MKVALVYSVKLSCVKVLTKHTGAPLRLSEEEFKPLRPVGDLGMEECGLDPGVVFLTGNLYMI